MEFIHKDDIKVLVNPGFVSHQLLFPENSASERVTITRVVIQPGVRNERHLHETSEQIWIALCGSGELLLAEDATQPFEAGDVVRFADGDTHGLHNTTQTEFE